MKNRVETAATSSDIGSTTFGWRALFTITLLLGPAGPSWLDRRRLAGRFVDHAGRVTVSERWLQAVPAQHAA